MRILGVVAAAFLLWLAFPPVGIGVLVFVAPVPLLLALRSAKSGAEASLLGYLFGLVFFTSLVWWVAISTRVGAPILFLFMPLYVAPYAWLVWRTRDWTPWRWWIVAVGGWTAMEWVRGTFPFGGFPWGNLGIGVGDVAPLRATAQWIGESGLSVLAIGVAAGLTMAILRRRYTWAMVPVVLALLLGVAGALFPPTTDGNPLRVAVIQGGSPCPGLVCPNQNRIIFESHLALTRTLEPGSVDLVIWPESSAQYEMETGTNPQTRDLVAAEARRLDAYVLVGSTRAADGLLEGLNPASCNYCRGEATNGFLNVNVLFGPDGDVVGEYAKRQGVPFGEYIPGRRFLGWIKETQRVGRDIVTGSTPVVWELPQGPFASVICFEAAFPRHIREAVRAGARFAVVTTNESGYGRSSATIQFSEMTRMRAAENGIDVVHASITGSSAIIGADGTIRSRTGVQTSAVLRGTVGFRTLPPTLYTRLGDWVQWLAIVGLFGVAVARRWTGERNP